MMTDNQRESPFMNEETVKPEINPGLAIHLLKDLRNGLSDTPEEDIAEDLQTALDTDLVRILELLEGE